MSPPATPTHAAPPGLPLLPITPLDGASGYLRWKESVLLRLRTLGMVYLLFEKPPAGGMVKEAEKWARDDALCRGYILATLSDRLLPVYANYATAKAVWLAVARTYDLDMSIVSKQEFYAFQFVEDEPVLEQLAHLQALATTANIKLEDPQLSALVQEKLPPELATAVILAFGRNNCPILMDNIWDIAREEQAIDMAEEIRRRRDAQALQTTDEQGSRPSDDHRSPKRSKRTGTCDKCGKPGNIAGECRA